MLQSDENRNSFHALSPVYGPRGILWGVLGQSTNPKVSEKKRGMKYKRRQN